jgi:hypothetical protein
MMPGWKGYIPVLPMLCEKPRPFRSGMDSAEAKSLLINLDL